MVNNKNHWYDGLIYDKLIAPNQDRSFRLIEEIIGVDKTILDAGCGTGRLAFQIAGNCRWIDSVDLSIKNIEVARSKLSVSNFQNIRFHHNELLRFLSDTKTLYDYSILSYVIHEVDYDLRVEMLKKLSAQSDYIIIVDHLAPRPGGFWSLLNEIVEFIAGKDHYRNFKSYVANRGIYGLAKQSGLKIIDEIKNVPSTSHLVIISK